MLDLMLIHEKFSLESSSAVLCVRKSRVSMQKTCSILLSKSDKAAETKDSFGANRNHFKPSQRGNRTLVNLETR